ncbi:MAG: transglutaminase-like domain-containing protein [Promethearchaeota archaeon]
MPSLHNNYGVSMEKDPPFKLIIDIVDQDGKFLYADVVIDTGDEKIRKSGYSVQFVSIINYDLSEITITAKVKDMTKTVKPKNYHTRVVFNIPKPPPPPPPKSKPKDQEKDKDNEDKNKKDKDKEESKNKSRQNKKDNIKQIYRIIEEVKEIVQLQEAQGEGDHLNLGDDDIIDQDEEEESELDPDAMYNQAVQEFESQRHFDLIPKAYTEMRRRDVPSIINSIKSISKILNRELKKKFKGQKTIKVTEQRKGPISFRHTFRDLARRNPRITYFDLISKTPPKLANIFVDFSGSTNSSVKYGPNNEMVMIRESILLAALSIAETIVELEGGARIIIFSDSDHPFHCRVFEYKKGNKRKTIETILNIPSSGGTRLDEAVSRGLELNKKLKADYNFILLDGAPQEGYFRVDVDDEIQNRTIKNLKKLEENSLVFIIWAPSPFDNIEYDEFFFKRCMNELKYTLVVNVQSFPFFIKHVQKIWQMPRVKRKLASAYKTDEVYPFKLSPEFKNKLEQLNLKVYKYQDRSNNNNDNNNGDGELDVEKTLENVKNWIKNNFRYTLPYGRKYRTAMEVVEAGNGCCGEISNLIVGILRYFGIASGILEVDFIEQVRINHAMVGYVDYNTGKKMCIDLTMGDINTKDAISNPISDERWKRLMDFWRGNIVMLKRRKVF